MLSRKTTVGVSLLVVGVALVLAQNANFADNLQRCVKTTDINVCLRNTLEELRGFMSTGIPELNLRPTEPLRIENIGFQSSVAVVNVDSKFSNVVVRGLSQFQTHDIRADIRNRDLFLKIMVPRLDIQGNYVIKGNIFFIPIGGNGDFVTQMRNVTGVGKAKILPVGPPGNQRLTVSQSDLDFEIEGVMVRMNNLFNGKNPEFAREVNKALNANSDLIINEVKPQIRDRMTTLVERVMNDAFSKINAVEFINTIEEKRVESGSEGGTFVPPPPPPQNAKLLRGGRLFRGIRF